MKKIRKMKIRLAIKVALCVVMSVLSIVLFILQFNESKNYKTVENKVKLYDYTLSSDIKYNVKLKDNNIFDTNILAQDGTYISSLVDNIELNITNNIESSEIAKISCKYNVIAILKGNISEENEIKTLWSKYFKLKENVEVFGLSSKKVIEENIDVDYDLYNNIAKEINETIKVPTQNLIEIMMDIELNIETKHGLVKEKMNPTITIPVNNSFFTITSSNIDEKIGDISKTESIIIEPNFTRINIYRFLIGISIIIIVLIIIFTTNPSENDIYRREIKTVFKNYSKLLVGVSVSNTFDFENIYHVKSIEDLIKISDELEKPILYNSSDNIENINDFYIIYEKSSYIYSIKTPKIIISDENLGGTTT